MGEYVNNDGVVVKKNPNKVVLIGVAAVVGVAIGFGAVALVGGNGGGHGGNDAPVVTEAPVPAPDGGNGGNGTGTDGGSVSGTDLGGLTTAEETAILDYEDAYGVDLGAVDERTLLDNAYLAIDEYALYGYSFDDILDEGIDATGDPAWVLDAMTVAFDYLAPEYSDAYTAWYYA